MQKAYLRDLNHTNQCELVFLLKLTNDKSESIEQHIHSVQQITDNVQSLLDHTKNKINMIVQQKLNKLANMEITISLTKGGRHIPGETKCRAFIKEYQNIILTVCDQTFQLIMNAPLVQSITLPVMLFVNYAFQPVKFKTVYTDKILCKYFWYASLDKVFWTEVGSTFAYKPTPNDEKKYLKFRCVPVNTYSEGPPFEIISETTVKQMPSIPNCPFMKRHEHTRTYLSGKEIRIVSYNILSSRYSETNAQFPYCSPEALSIDYRKQLILKELTGYNADIICLQELDLSFYQSYFKPNLARKYKSIFHKKGNRIPEGLACFYNVDRFKMLESMQLVIAIEIGRNNLFRQKWNLIKQSDRLREGIIKQPTSLQVTILKLKEHNEIIIVANTHLYYHCEANDIRLLQASVAMDYIKSVSNHYKRSNKQCKVSVIFCGDFNSVPTSAVYEFFTRAVIQHTFETENETPLRNICLNHPFKFVSAYGTPKYTNYTGDFKGCLDYIFYDKNNFSLTECIPLPDESVLAERIALPNEVFPSDHIALVVNLKLL